MSKRKGTTWIDTINPIRGLSIQQAKNIFDSARSHGSPLLQKIYAEIEAADPTLMTCVDRRASAVSGIGWNVVARSEADDALADEQKEALTKMLNGIDNLNEAIEHLDNAYFRGYSHVQPLWEQNAVRHIALLDSWNFLYDRFTGTWYYNPEATIDISRCEEITTAARLVTVTHRLPIDWPALPIFIRKSLGERDFGRYVERYGLPNFVTKMAANATDKQRNEYLDVNEAIKDGRGGVIPSTAEVSTVGTESRGTDPFSVFIRHQDEAIVLMSTGGTLTSLAQADTGSLAGGAQMQVWRQIVRRDAVAISSAIQRSLAAPFIKAEFHGQPIAVEFRIEESEKPGVIETAELATKLKTAGYLVDQGELEEQVGLKLVKDETQSALPGGFNALANKILNKEISPKSVEASEPQAKAVLKAFAEDMGPASEAVAKLLKNPTPETAAALLDELPALLPDDPALATVIAEAMAEEFGDQIVKNKTDAQGNEHDNGNGQFTEKGAGGVGSAKSGKPEERKIHAVKSSPRANEQAAKLGYRDVGDMLEQAKSVTAARVSEIQNGYSGKCKAHEAVAVISEDKPFKDAEGNTVHFGNDILEHYVEGRRRRNNEPKVSNLEDLPYAIKAVKSDSYGVTRLTYPSGTTPDPLNPPRGTQREYHIDTDRGQLKVFVYIQGGVINGWHVQDK